MKIYAINQGDEKWKSVKLGNGPSTIGSAGCLLCAISMINGKNSPLEINNDKSNFQGDLWIWSSINKYGGKYNARYNYSENKLNELLNKYGAVVVAVKNFGHYVVMTKSGKMYDPNGGKIVQGFGSYTPCAIYDQSPNSEGHVEIEDKKPEPKPEPTLRKATTSDCEDIWNGKYGNQPQRDENLRKAGIDPTGVQARINAGEGKPQPAPTPAPSQDISKGNKVKFTGTKDYNGTTLAAWTHNYIFDVIEAPQGSDRIVIGKGKAVTAAVKKSDLQKV